MTVPARTLVDIAELLPRRRTERVLDEARYLNRLSGAALTAAIARGHGRRGAGYLAAISADHDAGTTRTRSQLEELFLDLCRRNSLPSPTVNARIAGMEVDFLWRDARVVAETDGWTAHRRRSAFEWDRRKALRLQASGYAVLRFTYSQVTEEPESVARSLVRALG